MSAPVHMWQKPGAALRGGSHPGVGSGSRIVVHSAAAAQVIYNKISVLDLTRVPDGRELIWRLTTEGHFTKA